MKKVFLSTMVLSGLALAQVATPVSNTARKLKKKVSVSRIATQKFKLTDGTELDFDYAINQQFLTALVNSNKFIVQVPTENSLLQMQNGVVTSVSVANGATRVLSASDRPDCEIDPPQFDMLGQVLGYEFDNSWGLTLGYQPGAANPLLPIPLGISSSLYVKKARMWLTMSGVDPFSRTIDTSTLSSSLQNEIKVNGLIDFRGIAFNADYYYKTPLGQLSNTIIQSAVASVGAQSDNKFSWHGTILSVEGSVIAINAGENAGIKEGDEFKVYNVKHKWSGEACNSRYLGALPTKDPVAYVRVFARDSNMAYAEAFSQTGEILPGGRVDISNLVK